MPAPATVDEFLELVRKSGVVDENRLASYMAQLQTSSTIPIEPNKLAGIMIRDGLLTYFQAEQFLQGRWKRFTIGRYKVLERLGSGGMGQVFLCEHKMMRRRVAVKVLPTAKAEDSSALERFYREARAVAALDHPNIVRAYDIDQDGNLHFLVMEYVDGVSMQDLIKKFGPMDVNRAAHYVYQATIGLQHANQSGLVHRDIKPGNVLIERQGTVKILDMGLARFFNDEDDIITKRYDENVLGTADYLAPEQAIDSHGVDIRADIYSLGATFYYLLTGSPPFAEGTIAQKLIWHQTRAPRSVTSYRPDVPPELVQIVEGMMAKDVNQRIQSPEDLLQLLAPWSQPIVPPPDREMPQLCLAAQGRDLSGGPASQTNMRRSDSASSVSGAMRRPQSSDHVSPTRTNQATSTGHTVPPVRTTTPPVSPPPPPSSRIRGSGTFPAHSSAPAALPVTPAAIPRPPVVPAPVQDPYTPMWESLTSDTADVSEQNTERRTNPKRNDATPGFTPTPFQEPTPNPLAGKMLPIIVSAVLGLVLLAGAAWYFLFRQTSPEALPVDEMTIYVGAPEEGQVRYPTIRVAVEKVKPGSVIVVLGDEITEEPLTIIGAAGNKNVTIQAGNAKQQVLWRVRPPSKQSNPHPSMLELRNIDGFRLKGFVLDGEGHVESGIRIVNKCPGTTLEDIHVKNARSTAIRCVDASGEKSRPILLRRVTVTNISDADAAVAFKTTNSKLIANQFVQLADCRIDGPCKVAAILLESSMADFQIVRCRVANFPTGLLLRNSQSSNFYQITLANNTFYNLGETGLKFDAIHPLSAETTGKTQFMLNANYFAKTMALLVVPAGVAAIPEWAPVNNGRDAVTPANLLLPTVVVEASFLGTSVNDPATFLVPDPKSKLVTSGPNGSTIGYTPAP